jgi:protein SCO1/2
VSFSAKELDAALKEAGRKRVGLPIEQLLLLCFHYRPLTGKYGDLVMTIVRTSGVITIAGLLMLVSARRRRSKSLQRFDNETSALS